MNNHKEYKKFRRTALAVFSIILFATAYLLRQNCAFPVLFALVGAFSLGVVYGENFSPFK